jgi:hypothetical protein
MSRYIHGFPKKVDIIGPVINHGSKARPTISVIPMTKARESRGGRGLGLDSFAGLLELKKGSF